ncbi:TetR/AcrR family transcriptional regulator [Nocardia sp. NPDC050175]|uniref:TetR/AcrR family transcriptional regulator n=1 Tax=Nocardia sp. NPDC050175 TaxID=3364317 RepID=UPI0037914787
MKDLRAYGGVPADQRRNDRRGKLVAAVFDVVATDGIHAVTVRKVAANAGLSTRYVYESFADVDDLLRGAFDVAASEMVSTVEAAIRETSCDLRSTITATVTAIVDLLIGSPNLGTLLLSSGVPVTATRRRDLLETVASALIRDAGLDRSPLRQGDRAIDLVAWFLLGAFTRTLDSWSQQLLLYSREQFIHDNVELLLAVVGAAEKLT